MPFELSYWEKESYFNYDVIVIGSGIVGLNTAIHLKRQCPKLKIAVLERGFLPAGASTKNAGFACFGSISELIEQEERMGTGGLANLIEKRWKGLLRLRQMLGDKVIDYQCLGGYELFKKKDVLLANACVSKIEHFNSITSEIVGKQAFSLANDKINQFGFHSVSTLICNRYEAQIDTGKMMFSLMCYAQQLGILILNHCNVNRIDKEGKAVITDNGIFYYNNLIVATNAFIKSLIDQPKITPGRGQVLITKPIQNLKVAGTFHYDAGFYYFRNINGRILLGGGRNLDFEAEQTTDFGLTQKVQDRLENLLKDVILPENSFEIDQRWSGIMAFGKSLPPLIAEAHPGIFYATRCNGMGIAIGAQTGEILAEMVLKVL